jgi:hypothetical protein
MSEETAGASTSKDGVPDGAPPARRERATGLWLVFAAGAGYGLLMRLLFALPVFLGQSKAAGPMLGSFVVLVPLLLGGFSAYLLPKNQRHVGNVLAASCLNTLAFVGGTALLLIEGSICIAMALPIFLLLAMIGGLLGLALLGVVSPARGSVSALLVLPLIGGAFERDIPLPDRFGQSTASVHVAAPPETLWALINRAQDVRHDEMAKGWAWRIGVPFPQEAVTVESDSGRVRKLRWDKGVHFDEPILEWEENRFIRWRYDFAPDSIPPGALDEHVQIGGRHFDLLDTSYRLTPEEGGTRLDILVSYRVSTRFNVYAGAVAQWLVDDAARTILVFYQRRAEAAQRR